MQTSTEQPSSSRALPSADLTLDALARLAFDAAGDLYARGRPPSSVRALDGAPKGRMLAVRGLDRSPLAGPLRRFAGSGAFVWDGKTFASTSERAGTGINRVQIPWALGRQRLFAFETRLGPSLVDGRDSFILDYDLPDNPGWIRKVHDEIREVSPGLYLGPAMWKGAAPRQATTVLWFALDTGARGWS